MEKLEKQKCMFCGKDTLTLTEDSVDIPYFDKVHVFSMACSSCSFSKADVECEHVREPCKVTFTIENEEDLKVRVIKSADASIKVPGLKLDMRPGPASEGFVSNIEGLLNRFTKIIESAKNSAEEDKEKKAAKNLLKKLWKVKCGDMPLKIIIEDPSGNSGIVSEKASVEKLKVKK